MVLSELSSQLSGPRARERSPSLAFVGTALIAALGGACGEPSVPPAEQRTVQDPDRGYRLVVPPHWTYFGDEIRSPSGSVFTIEALSLVDADPKFLAQLPESIVPELEARTRYFFSVVEKPLRTPTTVAGSSGMRVAFPVRVRDRDAPSEVVYWIVRRGLRLYALRATYPPGLEEKDATAVKEILSSWQFTDGAAG